MTGGIRPRACLIVTLAALLLVYAGVSVAGGVLYLFPPTVQGRTFPTARPAVLVSRAIITVSESTTEFRFDQTFHNNNEFPLTGVFIFPLEAGPLEGAPEFSVEGVGAAIETVASQDFLPKLRKFTEEIAEPSLLGLAGKTVLYASGIHVSARGRKSVKLKFKVPTHIRDELLGITVPMVGERYSMGPTAELDVRVRYKMSRTVRRVFSTSHHPAVVTESPYRRSAVIREEQRRVSADVALTALFSGNGLDLRLLNYRIPGVGRWFMACALPPFIPVRDELPPTDAVFILDKSGSMGDGHIAEAQRALAYFLERLRPEDKFNVVMVGAGATKFSNHNLPAVEDNVAAALDFAKSAPSHGGTDLYNALAMSWDLLGHGARNGMVVLLSDGRPTIGVCDAKSLTDQLRKWGARRKARIFALALGESPNYPLLDSLALETKGVMRRVEGGAVVEGAEALFASAALPAASDLSISVEGMKDAQTYPSPGPITLSEGMAEMVGRLPDDGGANVEVVLQGRVRGKKTVVRRRLSLTETTKDAENLPAIWAMRRYAALWEASLHGGSGKSPDKTLLSETAAEFGLRPIELQGPGAVRNRTLRASDPTSGALLWRLRRSLAPADALCESCRLVRGEVFRSVNGKWIDTRFRPGVNVREVSFLSRAYFDLLEKSPELAEIFALGPEIVVARSDGALKVVTGATKGSPGGK